MGQNQAATDAKLAIAAAKITAAQNVKPPCEQCIDAPELQAAILFPALGTPYVAPDSTDTIKLFLVVEDKCLDLFGIKSMGMGKYAPLAWFVINKHLRLMPFSDPKISADIKSGGLYSSDSAAMTGIQVFYHGTYAPGSKPVPGSWCDLIVDHLGHPVATLRPSSTKFFVDAQAGYGAITPAHSVDPRTADIENRALRHLFEIELNRNGLATKPATGQSFTLAWMVTCAYAKVNGANGKPVLPGVTHWEHQDKLIYDFLEMMRRNKQHFALPFEFNIDEAMVDQWPSQYSDERYRLKSYHPVVFKAADELVIGHLSDVHVSSRHFALSKSGAEVVPGIKYTPWKSIANSFVGLAELFVKIRNAGADVLFVTGDLIDFNHNIDPSKFPASSFSEQWKLFNLRKYFNDGRCESDSAGNVLYPRGLDDMMIYSLIKSSYINGCPVFMCTGNHEAYDLPYGVSPRLNYVTARSGTREAIAINQKKEARADIERQAAQLDAVGDHEAAAKKRAELTEWEQDERTDSVTVMGAGLASVADAALAIGGIFKSEKDKQPDAYNDSKANEGIAADHNLTIYEACLAYGPTSGTVLKTWNFVPANFDWFFMIFTPLADFKIDYGSRQRLIGLDWGESEVMVNINPTEGSMGGVLPRASRSINDTQKCLIADALGTSGERKNIIFSHFTVINYDQPVSYESDRHWFSSAPSFILHDKAFTKYNVGTFGKARDWFFQYINGRTGGGQLHYTLGGHSHRAGAYAVDFEEQASYGESIPAASGTTWVKLAAFEPSCRPLEHSEIYAANFSNQKKTRILVSSCGGPIGVQNHRGELNGWNLKPPSGMLLKTARIGACDEFTRVASSNILPRFCVALDYMVIMEKVAVVSWGPMDASGVCEFRSGGVLEAVAPFVDHVTFYVYDEKNQAFTEVSSTLGVCSIIDNGATKLFDQILNIGPEGYGVMRNGSGGRGGKGSLMFCSIEFNNSLSANSIYSHFDFKSPWIFPISFVGGLLSRTEGQFGEVPNFDKLTKIYAEN